MLSKLMCFKNSRIKWVQLRKGWHDASCTVRMCAVRVYVVCMYAHVRVHMEREYANVHACVYVEPTLWSTWMNDKGVPP